MRRIARLVLAACALSLLTGCSYVNSLTGQTDNTVLPGKREDAIPGRTSFPQKQDVQTGSTTSPSSAAPPPGCAAGDPDCQPPSSTGDTFSDPQ